ncbi:sce7725 family protein [Confluentibacter sediminis]|uniref:sce7725 family protein n=1 Tax=Confluentibacter sediminis TaxID=2219045 RepID=UPI000DAECC3C|nr:sce7725 family protein [Confluentibacter sediminis]
MYFPYLRARQFELISLRELVSEDKLQNITPVLEPVKQSFNNLNLAHKVFQEKDFNAYLIVNPFQGEMPGDTEFFLTYISELENKKFLHAFHYSDNADYILSNIEKYNLEDCLIICLDNFSDEESLKQLCSIDKISKIMLLEPHKYRSLDRHIKSLGKLYIRLDDIFEKQQKNADFLNIQAHKFTEEHLYYGQDSYQAFADFTVLPSEFVDGGSTPRAVAIHLTYLNAEFENQIWIRHFTSTSNDSIANVQGKFAEAATKAVDFCINLPLLNSATNELKKYLDEARYPGLGTVKKISIKNHLLIVSDFLN